MGLGNDILGAHLSKRAIPCNDVRMQRIWFCYNILRRGNILDHVLLQGECFFAWVFGLHFNKISSILIVTLKSIFIEICLALRPLHMDCYIDFEINKSFICIKNLKETMTQLFLLFYIVVGLYYYSLIYGWECLTLLILIKEYEIWIV